MIYIYGGNLQTQVYCRFDIPPYILIPRTALVLESLYFRPSLTLPKIFSETMLNRGVGDKTHAYFIHTGVNWNLMSFIPLYHPRVGGRKYILLYLRVTFFRQVLPSYIAACVRMSKVRWKSINLTGASIIINGVLTLSSPDPLVRQPVGSCLRNCLQASEGQLIIIEHYCHNLMLYPRASFFAYCITQLGYFYSKAGLINTFRSTGRSPRNIK